MPIERLTTEDRMMLWPDQIWPQDMGALAILDGTNLLDHSGRIRIEAIREVIASRLHLMPRLRQRLYVPPKRLGGPLWVDDPAFDLGKRIGVVDVPVPGAESQLLLVTEELRRRRLDPTRPLWEFWLLQGLPNKRVGLFVRMHHSMADGIAGVATLGMFLDIAPDVDATPKEPWTPAPQPTDAELLADNQRLRRRQLSSNLSILAHPVRGGRRLLAAWPAIRELLAEEHLETSSLEHLVGHDRTVVLIRSRIDVVKEIAHSRDAKVNDVLLAAIAGGLRSLLRSRGESIDRVMRVYVPVSLRHGQYEGARGNRIAQMVIPLPIGVADPADRLRRIAAGTASRKLRSRPSLGELPTHGIVGLAMLKLINRQRVNVTTADLPGPEFPLYFAGAPLLELFPILPLIRKVSLGVGALSYAGQFNITAVADRDSYPDLEVFAAGVREDLGTLTATIAGPARAGRLSA